MFNYPMAFMSSGGHATNLSYPNMAYSGLLPTMYTNYGGDLQVTNINPYGGYNLGIMFNPIAAQTWGMPSIFSNAGMSAGTQDLSAATQRAQSILMPIYNNMASGSINQATQAIQSALTKLEAKLAAEGTTEEEKTAIQETIDKLKEQAEKLDNLKKSTDLDPQTAYEQARDIAKEVNTILSDAAKAAANTEKNKTNETAKTEEPAKAEETEETSSTNKNDNNKKDEPKAEENAEEETQGAGADIDNFSIALSNDTDTAYKALSGPGTDDSDIEDIVEVYSQSGQMLDLMLCYNNKYGDAKGESFIEAFMDDEDHNEACDMLPKIVNSLVARAKAMGVYDEDFRKCEIAVTRQVTKSDWSFLGLGAIFSPIDDDVVCENINKMVKKMGEKAGSKYAEVHKEES